MGTKSVYARSKTKGLAPRAGIISSMDVKLTAMDNWCNRDCAVALARIGGRQTMLVSLYLDIHLEVRPSWLEDLMNMAEQKGFPILMGIDSNAHSTMFGTSNNNRGNDLEDFILQHGMNVENVGLTPTFETRRGDKNIATHIDVTLSRDLQNPITGWRVDQNYNASDHNTIFYETAATKTDPELVRPWAKADWALFSRLLSTADYRVPKDMSMKKLDKLVERMYSVVGEALDRACPRVEMRQRVGKSHWATGKHDEGKKKVSELYKRAKATGRQSDWENYKTADKDFKRMCKNDKNRAWRKYKECIQSEKEMAALAKTAQYQDRRDINVLTKPDGTSTNPGSETIELLTQTHFPAATDKKHVTYNNRRNLAVSDIKSKYNDWINATKIKSALTGFEKKKSPGPDDMKPLIFDHLPPEYLEVLEIVYKANIHLGYTPKAWKRTKVIFISKPGKEAYDKPKSFRPISLSNYLLKGLERLVGWRMDRALEANPLHHKQHGFLSGKSTESAISNTVNYIEKHIMNKQHCAGVFLDISAAFDSIKPGHVRQALLKHGGDPEMVQWYFNYITHRDIEIAMHGEHKSFTTGLGFPQGGVCSAKFWLIAFDYAIQIINRYSIEGNGYADDCSALCGGRRLDHALKKLQKMLDDLTEWGKSCGLKFNPEKSVAVIFTRRHKCPPFRLRIDGGEIEYKTEVKYLGITLDSKLHWKEHIEDKLTSAKKYIGKVANMTRNNWGPKPKLMRWAYIGIVRPMLCYGVMIWGHRAPELLAKFRRINRMAINTFANFPKSTPTTALEIMLDVLPLHIFCEQEALAARVRLDPVIEFGWHGTSHTKNHSTSHLRFLEDRLVEYNIRPGDTDACKVAKWDAGFRVNWDSFDGKSKHLQMAQFSAYTDGSKLEGQTGAGLVIYKGKTERLKESHRLPEGCTVFQAEVAAISQAAKGLLRIQDGSMKFVKIFVDSQAALAAVGNPFITSRLVASAVNNLNKLAATSKSVTLVWIPAHKGHAGNEEADKLAKAGSKESDPNKLLRVKQPTATMKANIRKCMYEKWEREWITSKEASHTKSFYGKPDRMKAKYVYKLARLELGRFVRLVTGHNNLGFFQHKLGLSNRSECRFCGDGHETLTHFLQVCPRLRTPRGDHFGESIPTNDMRWSVRSLLEFSYTPGINDAYEGTWAGDDPFIEGRDIWDSSMGLDWLDEEDDNHSIT